MTAPGYTHTRLHVNDMGAAVRFYRDVMGLALTLGGEGDVYSELASGDLMLGLFLQGLMAEMLGEANQPGWGDGQLIALAVERVDEAVSALQKHGAELVLPPTDRPNWGLRTAHFRDPDGRLLEVHGPLAAPEQG
ncbi:MAG: VOC family protein [Anaerolineae bacterium]|nr:VOC family protein [Anaerolineae bacterium]